MNIINKGLLKMVLLPRRLYIHLGVDAAHLQVILATKLLMDDRRPNTLQQTQHKKNNKPVSAATVGTVIVSAIMGFLFLFAFFIPANPLVQLTLYFSIFFFMLSASLISDFTSVLIDVRDNFIIIPKPVNDRTVVTARILHIFIHISKLVVPMSLPGLVYMLYAHGAYGSVILALMVILLTTFSIFFINAVYILILKVTTPEKFKNIISYIQIIFAVVLYASYQVVPRILSKTKAFEVDLSSSATSLLLPFYWFASGWQVLFSFKGNPVEITAAGLSFCFPFVSLYLVIKYLAPSFNKKLSMINSVAAENKPTTRVVATKGNYVSFFSRLLTTKGAERMGFLFTWKMTTRSRDFRMKVYPSIGYILVYGVIILMTDSTRTWNDLQDYKGGGKILLLSAIYICSFLLIMAVNQISFSEKFKASWIYYTAPVVTPGHIILGSLKALLVKFYLPVITFITIAGLFLMGPGIIPNLILGASNQLLIVAIISYINQRQLPFATIENNNAKSGNFVKSFFTILCTGAVIFLHYIAYSMLPLIILFTLLSIIAVWLLLGSINDTNWEKIKSAADV